MALSNRIVCCLSKDVNMNSIQRLGHCHQQLKMGFAQKYSSCLMHHHIPSCRIHPINNTQLLQNRNSGVFCLLSRHLHTSDCCRKYVAPLPEYDWQYLCNVNLAEEIQNNIDNRKGVGNIYLVVCMNLLIYILEK